VLSDERVDICDRITAVGVCFGIQPEYRSGELPKGHGRVGELGNGLPQLLVIECEVASGVQFLLGTVGDAGA
jgi:hypothetical protein